MNGTSVVRYPSSRLAEGIVTHISRMPVDMELARSQHAAYADALAASGWAIRAAPAADDCPDSVFVEDTDAATDWLRRHLAPGDVVLFKASNAVQLSRVAQAVLADEGAGAGRRG